MEGGDGEIKEQGGCESTARLPSVNCARSVCSFVSYRKCNPPTTVTIIVITILNETKQKHSFPLMHVSVYAQQPFGLMLSVS